MPGVRAPRRRDGGEGSGKGDLRRDFGITHAEFEVLLRLSFSSEGRARIQDLATASLLTRSGTSRVVERLAHAGYVERLDAEEDGRGSYAVLTKAGRQHFQDAARQHVALVRRAFLRHYTPQELETRASFWKRLEPGQAAETPTKPPRQRSAPRRPKKPGRSAR